MGKTIIRVVELFAGVGGFRLGLENSDKTLFKTIWANQWEPGRKTQHAYDCYIKRFNKSDNHINDDIEKVKHLIPDHDLLVGGFPCQDYSVARTQAKGIEGKKGVLWWSISDIIGTHRPTFVVLENVDRLLKSPTSQRGRDFGIMLRMLNEYGYYVEWRVINAAEYGFAQKRRRVFIFAVQKNHLWINRILRENKESPEKILSTDGFFAPEFQVEPIDRKSVRKYALRNINDVGFSDLVDFSDSFRASFENAGFMYDHTIYTARTKPIEETPTTLGEILEKEPVDEKYFLKGNLQKWLDMKNSKKIPRVKPNGEEYFYSEGTMAFPDNLDGPARTMLTSESSVNRSTHVIEDPSEKRLRLLTPVECEALNGFTPGWTDTGMPHKFRYFVMGNALVVGVVKRIGNRLKQIYQS